jgi:polyketide cyclase/dehydrase/lipid transport protein
MPSVSTHVSAPADRVWRLVSDVARMGEWSPETISAEWLDGATGPTVGARFRGRNKRRGSWRTTCTVTAAEPAGTFAFRVGRGETTWRYDVASDGDDCVLTESFEIVKPPGPLGRWFTKLGTGVSWSEREDDLVEGMRQTLERLKLAAEANRE